ncbi:hypothetical protein JX265_001513 [Neoarthrinium moseri]|uniref:Cell wall protein PhiA n=1 Tax=Neoarthrinium moseri TaxID=1658444 RepID=A0A9P9WVK5_9PEZI|nr:hypothetical protein JX266_012348 [Neoarthrinium moseri]KAI1879892.1 hypothetical protein JX265_001513 [Neoarthrinium moseri]
MQFKTLAVAAATAAGASAQNSTTPSAFGVLSIRSGSQLQYAGWSAASGGIFNLLPEQKVSCDPGADESYATFTIVDGALNLYSNQNPPQQLYVDRSGMGMGKIGYTTGAEPAPRSGERTGWAVTGTELTFDGSGFVACPGYEGGAWEIWLGGVSDHPGWNYNCTGVGARVVPISEPVSCLYE